MLRDYHYVSRILLISAFIFLIKFLLVHFFSEWNMKVNVTQALLTLTVALLVLSYMAHEGYEQEELNSWMFFGVFIAGIPLLYHLLYLMFFSDDMATKIKPMKVYILGGLMVYLSLIWSNVNRLAQSTRPRSMIGDTIRILTYTRT